MRNAKRVCAGLILSLVIVALPGSAYASPYLPTRTWNLSTQGQYNFSGSASLSDLFSNYLFTGVSSARIDCTNKSLNTNLTVKLIRDDPYIDSAVSTVSIPKQGRSIWTVTGMSSSKRYYLKFNSPCNFSGNIRKP